MPYITHNKETEQYKLFGSLPKLCKDLGLDHYHMLYIFSKRKITQYQTDKFLIVKVSLEK